MANVKITDLTAYTNPDSTDVLPIVDVGADVTKKVSIADLLKNASSGTAAAPGIAFDGDSNTGIYSPGADQVAVATNGQERLFVDSSGNVGIGTTTDPTKLLAVNGDALINGLNVGRGPGDNSTNTVVGSLALNANTTGGANTAVGRRALNANTEGSLNTALGQVALNGNITGENNTALGTGALRNNTLGSSNTAVGRGALTDNLEGSFNTTVGHNAGKTIQGSNNTILGAYVGTSADATLSDTVIISAGQTERMRIKSDGTINFVHTAMYADNTAAKAGGLVDGDVYRKSDGTLMIVYT